MNFIYLLEKFLLPGIYISVYSGLLLVFVLIALRLRQLSFYQERITKAINPEQSSEDTPFEKNARKLLDVFYKTTYQTLYRFKILNEEEENKIQERLEKAGIRHQHSITIFILGKSAASIGSGILFLILNETIFIYSLGLDQPLLMFLIGLFLGIRYFETYLDRKIKAYRNNVKKALPDAIDLLLICIEAGYSNEHALIKISEEFHELFPELANEFALTAKELKIMPERIMAWKNFAKRTELSEINAIVNAFAQNDKYGTSIVTALRNQIEMMRNNRVISAEEQAAKIPVYLAIPLSIFFLPIIFVIILSPALLRIFELF